MDVGVLDQRFSLSEYWQGKSLVSRVQPAGNWQSNPPIQAIQQSGNQGEISRDAILPMMLPIQQSQYETFYLTEYGFNYTRIEAFDGKDFVHDT